MLNLDEHKFQYYIFHLSFLGQKVEIIQVLLYNQKKKKYKSERVNTDMDVSGIPKKGKEKEYWNLSQEYLKQ